MNADRSRLLGLLSQQQQEAARLSHEGRRFQKLKRQTVKPIVSFNLFQTFRGLAQSLVDHCRVEDHHTALEPSAGMGRLITCLPNHALVTAYDISNECCQYLFENIPDVRVRCADFLTVEPVETFDRIIMNPPFKMGRDILHITHARRFLATGGRLVALCYDGVKQNKTLRPMVDEWEPLGSGLFKGTTAAVVRVTINN